MPQLPRTDLTVSDLCLGGNVFGWTADEPTSFALLDRFHDAASNYSAKRLTEALQTAERLGVTGYVALQPHYNLMERPVYEAELQAVAAQHDLGVMPYFGLARGFLTGKYRAGETVDSPRAQRASQYVGEKGDRVLAALQEVADAH